MRALVLVGGKGTRLYPLTKNLPKPMAPVVLRPHLERVNQWLGRHGVTDVILTLHYKPKHFQDYFGEGSKSGVRVHYVDEPQPLGTGGAIRNAQRFFDSTFLVFNGDILTDLNLTEVVRFHKEKGAAVTIALQPVDDPTRYGVVELDSNSRILRFVEKPSLEEAPSNLINAGIYVMEPHVLEYIPEGVKYSVERGLFPTLIEHNEPVYGFAEPADYWIDIGNLRRYLQVHIDALAGRAGVEIPGHEIQRGVWVEDGVELGSVDFTPPVVVGRNCKIGHGAKIGPYAVIGEGSEVGEGTRIWKSVIWPECKIGKEAVIEEAILASRCTIESGAGVGRGTVLCEGSHIGWKSRLGEVDIPEGEGT